MKYRRSGGVKTSPLPDFYIEAHAAIRIGRLSRGMPLAFAAIFPA